MMYRLRGLSLKVTCDNGTKAATTLFQKVFSMETIGLAKLQIHLMKCPCFLEYLKM